MTRRRVPLAARLAIGLAIVACDDGRPVAPRPPTSEFSASLSTGKGGPSNLFAAAFYSAISLSWTDNSHNESEFRILRSSSGPSGAFAVIARVGANASSYSDTTIAPTTQYCYQVQGYQNARLLGTTNTSCVVSRSLLPTAPYNVVTVLTSGGEINISWQDSTILSIGYRIERGPSTTGPFTALKTIPLGTAYADYDVPVEQPLCYRVVTINRVGEGPPSGATCTGFPAPPTNITAHSPDDHTVLLTWTDASIYEDGYAVYRVVPGAGWTLVASLQANATSFRDTGLQVGVLYSYSVRVRKDAVQIWGPTVQTITADAPPATPAINAFPLGSTITETNWTPVPLAVGYVMERSSDNGVTWQATSQSASYSYQAPPPLMQEGLTPEQPICFRVTAYNDRGSSTPSNTSCTIPLAPPMITDIVVTDTSFDVSWTDDPNATQGYEIDYTICNDYPLFGYVCNYYLAGQVPAHATSFHVGGLASETEYDFQIFGLRDGGHSSPALFGMVTPTASAPASSRVLTSVPLPSWRGPFARYMSERSRSDASVTTRVRPRRPGGSFSSKTLPGLPIPVGVPTLQRLPMPTPASPRVRSP